MERFVFKSSNIRDEAFNDALKFLQDNKSQVIALCGMGGVGKTTMMKQLKKVATEKKMFDWIVKVVIGRSPNMFSIQNDIAIQLGCEGLLESLVVTRADRLGRKIKILLDDDDKRRILVILDDVWEKIELKNIGLETPLPNGVKLLLTSRSYDVCQQIAAYADSVLQVVTVDVLDEMEARDFFFLTVGVSEEEDPKKYQIGCDIVRKCHGLPLALEVIAPVLRHQEGDVWRDVLSRLKKNYLHDNLILEVITISYESLKDEDKEIFLHRGLFPGDYDIPIEYLTRYAWGLKLLKNVSTLREARERTNTCVGNLINANLLIKSDRVGCVKMHDLLLSFVLSRVSRGDRAWIIDHDDGSKWHGYETGESCKSISLTCMGMSEFRTDFKFPNLSLLQLMYGDMSLKFPDYFYENMKNLEVIALYGMQYPSFPRSLGFSTNLRTLILHECKLMFDYSFVGDLTNLEVLSFAHSGIHKLPSKIGNLKRLKLLDLTGCIIDLRIGDGVFRNLRNLEELYMRVSNHKTIRFSDANWEELKILSRQLYALEMEFVEKDTRLKNVFFKKLDKFKISIGCLLEEEVNDRYSLKNTLKLVTEGQNDILDCKINELFKKTEKLHLQVKDMICLKDVLIHPNGPHSFCCLRDLEVSNCEKLKFLFTVSVASGLMKLQRLKISSCPVFEALVYDSQSEIDSGSEMIKFEELKFLSLVNLPKFISLFLVDNVVDLPQLVELELDGLPNFTSIYSGNNNTSTMQQPFLNSQIKISKLKKLNICCLERLNQIWACEEEVNHISMLREIQVERCDSLVNLFPTNPMRLLNHLEEIKVKKCGSIKEIFNIDLGCSGEVEQLSSLRSIQVEECESLVNLFSTNPIRLLNHLEEIKVNKRGSIKLIFNMDLDYVDQIQQLGSINLRSIDVFYVEKVKEVWRIKGGENNTNSSLLIRGLEAVESIQITGCESFKNVFTPTNTIFDMRELTDVIIKDCRESVQGEKVNFLSRKGRDDRENCNVVEVVFEIENPNNGNDKQPLLPDLLHSNFSVMERMSHVWKCNSWNNFLHLQKQHQQSSFHNLTAIRIRHCENIKYLFSSRMAKLLSNLNTIHLSLCDDMEQVVSNKVEFEYKEITTLFPHLHLLSFEYLKNLKCIGGGVVRDQFKSSQVHVDSWDLCQYSRNILVRWCDELSSVIPSSAAGQMQKLEVLEVHHCESLKEVFETQGINNNNKNGGGSDTTRLAISRPKNINVPQLSNLKKLVITFCGCLQHVFTFSTIKSLLKLEELAIHDCKAMKVIVKKENREQDNEEVQVFHYLRSLKLFNLPNLEGFFLGKNGFQWPLLEKVMISKCPQMKMFTFGQSTAPELKYIHTSLGKHSLECGLNFHVDLHQTQLPSSDSMSLCSATPEQLHWSFHNLIEIYMAHHWKVKNIIPSNNLRKLHKLENIRVHNLFYVEEIFEVVATEDKNSCFQDSPSVVENLRRMELKDLFSLKHIWKSNHHQRTVLFPNLTTISIHLCYNLKHVFTSSMVGSLLQLQELHISDCPNMEVIIKEEEEEEKEDDDEEVVVEEDDEYEEAEESKFECDVKMKEIELPCLKSLKLEKLKTLKGFCLGDEDFSFPSLHTLEIKECPEITVFTKGHLVTPMLK